MTDRATAHPDAAVEERADDRDESETERLDRNWAELLQELRVIQTGTQILTGFLLTLAFQPRFADLDTYQVSTYLGLVISASIATILALTPVSLHRALFRKKAKAEIVRIANRVLKVTLATVAITLVGTVMLIFDVVVSRQAGWIAGGSALVLVILAWVLLPFGASRQHQ
ncbi:putative membrane protein [Leifsonia sp. AK011]|uniref:DUF6328 family protein n=1 Tax=Leifsonia sp. AK011 TaxID=2723075 RepID=UPI0015CEBE34|nr:DUF6328 family protein [Leifsonia sp. AK011]NYF10441.1 putative membrane protein [Leifsonia sp. AK011]